MNSLGRGLGRVGVRALGLGASAWGRLGCPPGGAGCGALRPLSGPSWSRPSMTRPARPVWSGWAVAPACHRSATTTTSRHTGHGSNGSNSTGSNSTTMLYTGSIIVLVVGVAYAAVPLYKLICSTTGMDGTPMTTPGHKFAASTMVPVTGHAPVRIRFTAATSDALGWEFKPLTKDVSLVPGQTALAFFAARNDTAADVVGISTYSVVPAKAAQYFNKIQCFCFEEQRLEPNEEVEMPVYFFVDPEFAVDPWMADVKEITLHYTFFRSKHQ